jgi:hypothetical protein
MWLAMLCALSAQVAASPRTDPTAGRAVFTGAVSPSATSIDVNPAALGLGVQSEAYLAAVGTLDQYSIDLATEDAVDATTVSPGSTIAFIWHSGTEGRITLGVELMHVAPGERFIESEALRYHTQGGYHRTVAPVSAGGSVRLTSRIFLGASFAAQTSFLKLRYARDTALEAGRDPDRGVDSDCGGAPCGIGNPLASEDYEVEASTDFFSGAILAASLGAVIRLGKDMWLGVAWHVPPGLAIQNEFTGTVQIERSPRDGGVALDGAATVYISQPSSVDVGYRARLREALDLHAGARWEHLSRFQAYDVRAYGSTLPPAGIPEWQPRPRGFESTFSAWAGVEQVERSSPVIVGGRLGIETSALPNNRTSPLTIAPTSFTLDAGAQWRPADGRWLLLATYGLQYFPTVDVTRSAYDPQDRLDCIDSGYDYTTAACESVRTGYAIPSGEGSYSRIEHALRLAVRIELD